MPIPPLNVVVELTTSILVPGFVVSLLVGWFVMRYRGAGLALFAGIAAANCIATPIPWWDHETGLGFLLATLALSLLTTLLDSRRLGASLLGAAWIALLAGILYYVETPEWMHRLVGVAVSALLYLVLLLAEAKLPRRVFFALLVATGLTFSLTMVHAHSARLADFGFIWLAGTAGLLMVSLFQKVECRGVAGLGALFLPFAVYYGQQNTFSEVPQWSFLLLVAAPLGSLVLLLPAQVKHRPWIAATLWLLCLATAAGLAMKYETISL